MSSRSPHTGSVQAVWCCPDIKALALCGNERILMHPFSIDLRVSCLNLFNSSWNSYVCFAIIHSFIHVCPTELLALLRIRLQSCHPAFRWYESKLNRTHPASFHGSLRFFALFSCFLPFPSCEFSPLLHHRPQCGCSQEALLPPLHCRH